MICREGGHRACLQLWGSQQPRIQGPLAASSRDSGVSSRPVSPSCRPTPLSSTLATSRAPCPRWRSTASHVWQQHVRLSHSSQGSVLRCDLPVSWCRVSQYGGILPEGRVYCDKVVSVSYHFGCSGVVRCVPAGWRSALLSNLYQTSRRFVRVSSNGTRPGWCAPVCPWRARRYGQLRLTVCKY